MSSSYVDYPNPYGAPSGPLARALHVDGNALGREISALIQRRIGMPEDKPQKMDSGIPFTQVRLDLSAAATGPSPAIATGHAVTVPGFALYYRQQGSAPGGLLDVSTGVGGVFQRIYPGCRLEGPFDNLVVARSADSATAGNADLIIEQRPDCRFYEPINPAGMPPPSSGTGGYANNGAAGESETYNAAAGTNAPTLSTQGMSTVGIENVLLIVQAGAGQTITSATVRWWIYDVALGAGATAAWVPVLTADVDLVGGAVSRFEALPVKPSDVGIFGQRLYAELITFVSSGGSGAPSSFLRGF